MLGLQTSADMLYQVSSKYNFSCCWLTEEECAGSRVIDGYSVYGDDNTDDCFGHGTHVSGIVGGLQYGVAKNVTIVPGRPPRPRS